MFLKNIFLLICLIIQNNVVLTYKLNVPKVLLPFHSSKLISFTLEVKPETGESLEDLCFVWSSSRHDIVSIEPVYDNQTTRFNGNECSTRALVSAVSKHAQRLTSIIFAKEIKTDNLIRCDVIVDQIDSIKIKHTTTHLFLEDSPESFTVEALDNEGNTFSSLDGLAFEWTIIQDLDRNKEAQIDVRNVLQIRKFIDSEYEISESIRQLESIGLSGHKILIEGLKTGAANVQAKLLDSFYKDNLKTLLVRLLVVANILIEPSYPVYLIPGSVIKYNAFLIKQTSVEKIILPSQQYYFETRNKTVCDLYLIDQTGSSIIGYNLGQTDLVLIDRNMKKEMNLIVPPPSSQINVVLPDHLLFSIKNWRSWILEVGRIYEIQINVHSNNRDLIYPSDNLNIKSLFDRLLFSIINESQNGSYLILKALKKGETIAKGFLVGTIENKLEYSIEAQQEIELLDPIQVIPSLVVFAFSIHSTGTYEYQLKAVGGSGSYYWHSKNTTIANINSHGLIKSSANRIGQAQILVTDSRNIDIKSNSLVYILEPVDIEILSCPAETKLGQKLHLNIKMNALLENGDLLEITDCSRIKFDVNIQDESIFRFVGVKQSNSQSACAVLVLESLKVGLTLVRITHLTDSLSRLQSNELQIGSYSDLKSYKKEVLLSKDSSIVVNLYDGPFFHPTQRYDSNIEISNRKFVQVESIEHDKSKNRLSFRIKCLDSSEIDNLFNIKFLVSNLKTVTNKCPIKFEYDINVKCTEPKSLELSQLLVNNEENVFKLYSNLKWKCPIKLSSNLVIANMERDLNIHLLAKDSLGNVFDNFTALKLVWEIENKDLLEKSKQHTCTRTVELSPVSDESLYKIPLGEEVLNSHLIYFQTFSPKFKPGETKLSAKLYLKEKLAVPNYLKSCLTIRIVDDAKIEPEKLVVFNHPSNIQTLSLKEGSGYFNAETEPSKIIKINQISSKSIEISPLLNDGLAYINIFDYCIPPPSLDLNKFNVLKWEAITKSQIKIAGINTILVNLEDDKLELKKKLKIYVQISDASGNLIHKKYFKLMNLTAKFKNNLNLAGVEQLFVVNELEEKYQDFTAVFELTGLNPGFIQIQFEAESETDKNNLIKSQLLEVQIYQSLNVEPKQIELVQGAEYQIKVTGGPSSSDTNIFYSITPLDSTQNQNILEINQNGLITSHNLGLVKITVKSIGLACLPFSSLASQYEFRCSPENKFKKVYSEDSLTVKIIDLQSVSLYAPIKTIKRGNLVPVYLIANDKLLTPINFGSCKNLKFSWKLNDYQLGSLENALSTLTHDESLFENSFSLRVVTKKSGSLKVNIKIEYKNSRNELITFSDSLDLTIVEPLLFTHFKAEFDPKNVLLLTPGTRFHFRTNFENSMSSYQLKFYNQESHCNNETIRIDQTGLLKVDNFKLNSNQECLVSLLAQIETNSKTQISSYLIKIKRITYSVLRLDYDSLLVQNDLTLSKVKFDQKSLIKSRLTLNQANIQMKWYVSYHDDLGDEFNSVNVKNLIKTNRNDLVQFSSLNSNLFAFNNLDDLRPSSLLSSSSENNFYIITLKPGIVVIELNTLSDNSEETRDYLGLVLKDFGDLSSLNKNELKIGDLICLNEENEGEWISESPGVVKLSSTLSLELESSYIGVCLSPGHTILKKTQNNEPVLKLIEVNVTPFDRVVKMSISSNLVTNSHNLNEIYFKVNNLEVSNCSNEFEVLFNARPNKLDLVPFKCEAGFYSKQNKRLEFFDKMLYAEIDFKQKNWVCSIKFIANSDYIFYDLIEQNRIINKEVLDPVKIKVSIDSKLSQTRLEDNDNEKIIEIAFLPAFFVPKKLIELSIMQNSLFNLVIKSTSLVQQSLVLSTNVPGFIKIEKVSNSDYELTYEISLTHEEFNLAEYSSLLQAQNGFLYVQVLCTLTQQSEKIPIKFQFVEVADRLQYKKNKGLCRTLFRSTICSFFNSLFDYSPNQIITFLVMVSLFLITVLCILKINSQTQPIYFQTTVQESPRQLSPKIKDTSSFNPYRYFSPSVAPASPSSTRLNTSANYYDADQTLNLRSPFRHLNDTF